MNNIQSGIVGTKTEQNLYNAYNGESKAYTKYNIYADIAQKENQKALADMYREMAHQEKEHAEIWMSYLGEMGNNLENLENGEAGEAYEANTMYEDYANTARKEGFDEIAEKFHRVGLIEASHAKKLRNYIQMNKDNTMYCRDKETTWVCSNCGNMQTSKCAPQYCSVCAYPQGYFKREV